MSGELRKLRSAEVPKCGTCGVIAVHAVGARPRGRGRRADVDAVDPGAIRIECEAGPDHDLDRRVGPGDDVAPDVVRVVGLEIAGGADRARGDPLAETWGEALDLSHHRLGRIAGVATRDVRVDPEGMQV